MRKLVELVVAAIVIAMTLITGYLMYSGILTLF